MKISAIVPAYIVNEQQVAWMKECLESICPLVDEVVVMDDGSIVKIDQFSKLFPNIAWYRTEKNQGSSRARNLAVAQAKNHLIFPLDCDDVVITNNFIDFVKAYDGTPLYGDMIKVRANGEEKVHQLLDFECDLLAKHVIAPVSVLFMKQQWKSLGGWDEQIDYIEDGEFNSRLMYIYCGKRFPKPVIKYRQHEFQKTRKYAAEHEQRLRKIIANVRSYKMAGCCGGRATKTSGRNNVTKVATTPISTFASRGTATVQSLPGAVEGRVLVKYMGGKGKGRHYYKGPVTKFAYKVVYGQFINVDPQDVLENGLFELVVKEKPRKVSAPKPVAPKPKAKRKAVEIVREPVVDEVSEDFETALELDSEEEEEDYMEIPDLLNQNFREVLAWLDDYGPTQEEAAVILDIEKQGKNRKKVIDWLERRL